MTRYIIVAVTRRASSFFIDVVSAANVLPSDRIDIFTERLC